MPRRTGHVAIQNANEPLRRVLRETGETQLDGVAAYAQVTVEAATGEIKVQRVVVAHDCGLVINPDGLRNQIEGNVVQGVSRALKEEVQFDARGVTSVVSEPANRPSGSSPLRLETRYSLPLGCACAQCQ
jgi:CO/xanthine dehydrogenase Mo-binding subunit